MPTFSGPVCSGHKIHQSANPQGILRGPLGEKISLYAADTLLYLGDVSASLSAALEMIDNFGSFSGIRINWDKLVMFFLGLGRVPLDPVAPLHWVSHFKYLGIVVQGDLSAFLMDNLYPILSKRSQ